MKKLEYLSYEKVEENHPFLFFVDLESHILNLSLSAKGWPQMIKIPLQKAHHIGHKNTKSKLHFLWFLGGLHFSVLLHLSPVGLQ